MLLRGLRWGLAGVLVAWTLIRLLGLDRGWPLVPLVAFTPMVAALALLAALVAVALRWRLFALVAAACAAVLAIGMAPRVIPNRAPADAPGVRLRVLAANVAGNAAAAADVVALARRLRVDVLSVVELPPAVALAYDAAGIGELLPQRSLRPLPGFAGTGLYARVPLQAAPGPQDTRFGISAAAAVAPGAAPVALFAVHVPAPTGPDDARQWRHDMRALPATGPTGQLRVLAGDFNATLDHGELRRLLGRGYRDAAEQAGSGLRPTWPTNRSLLPAVVTIDHVLADRRVRVASARTVTIPGSDHRGLLAELVVPRG
jgi:endonuclease/exonuclease/phosphatase (EEP) superfamily protein YafD